MKIVRITVVFFCLVLIFVALYRVYASDFIADTTATTPVVESSPTVSDTPVEPETSPYSENPDTTTYEQNPLAFEQDPSKDEAVAGFENTLPASASLDASPALHLPVRGAILMVENTGEILYDQNMHDVMPIASITKIMTMMLVFEEIDSVRIKLTDLVQVTQHAANMGGSQIWLDPSEKFTVEELLRAVCVASANDAAVALAEHVAGSETVFVEMMNRKASELGMENTNFVNACGLDAEGHLSSAYDVALMSRAIMEHDELVKYTTIWTDSLRNGQTMLVNTNKLVKSYQGITGLKTGTTGLAGICLAATATRDELSLIAVVLGATSSDDRFDAARTLLDYGFANFQMANMPNTMNFPGEIAVTGGAEMSPTIKYELPESMLLQKNQERDLTADLTLPEELEAPITEGTPIGTVKLYTGQSEVGSYDILAGKTVDEMTFGVAFGNFMAALIEF